MVKVSLITISLNSENTIRRTIESVLEQDYSEIEYIIIDGNSKDETLKIVESYGALISKIISEDDDGYYYALNKGLKNISGDIVGILNSDDFFANKNIVSSVVELFSNKNLDIVWGDVVYQDSNSKIKRFYKGKNITSDSFKFGLMPPHPSVFIRKYCYEKYGYFNTQYKFADYDLLHRYICIEKLNYTYTPKIQIRMETGGLSNNSIFSTLKINKEIYLIHKNNGHPISLFKLFGKIPRRIFEIFNRPEKIK